jgi:glycosyltransferase involved in cell wall biosynthesis
LRQRFKDFEFLIMDDGSSDSSPAILRDYADRDGRIRLFLGPRQGQIAWRNELLQLVKTDMVACADADDVCLPGRLEHQFCVMNRDPDLWVLGTAMITIDGAGGAGVGV